MLELSTEEIATVTRARRREGRGGTERKQSLIAIAEGWSQEKRGWADLARKTDGREEAGNSAVGRGRGPRLLRLPGLRMMLPIEKGEMLMVAAIDAGCYDWGDDKMVRLLMEEKKRSHDAATGEKEEAMSSIRWQQWLATGADRYDRRQCKGHLRFRRGEEEDDGRRLGREAAVERSNTSTVREIEERPPMERKETNLPTMCGERVVQKSTPAAMKAIATLPCAGEVEGRNTVVSLTLRGKERSRAIAPAQQRRETTKRMVIRVTGPQMASTDRRENLHQ
ncbi:hypothetical protein BHE74_00022121 [Ensete ventricosum]|nr:hypothetical protein BHE74_00022121 [Ensete ventricosum]